MKEYSEKMIQTAMLACTNDDQRRISEIGARLRHVKDMLALINEPPCNGIFLLVCRDNKPEFWCLLTHDLTTIGRGSSCDVELSDNAVSRIHATIVHRDDDDWELNDADSKNSFYINGRQCAQRILCDGDLIDIGPYEIIFTKYDTEE